MQQDKSSDAPPNHWDAIVIGSGMGGMTAAAFLATNDKRVLVLEQHSVLGGCSHVFRRKKQWEFDVGMHYVGDCGPKGQMPRMFRSLGLEGRVEFLPMDQDGFDTIVFPDLTFRVPVGWDNYLGNLITAFPNEEKNLRKLVHILSTLGHAIDRSRTPATNMGIIKMALDAKAATFWALLPMAKLLDHCQLSPKARAICSIQFGLYGCPPSRAPVVIHAGLLHNYIHGGAWYPKGGGQIFSAHLLNVIQANNGLARTSSSVNKIIIEGGRVAGVRLDSGEEFRSSIVVSNADLKRTYIDLIGVENLPRGIVKKVNNYKMSAPFLNVYLGVDVDLSKQIPKTNYFSMPSSNNLEETHKIMIDEAYKLPRDQWLNVVKQEMPAFIHCGSMKDPSNKRHAPEGCSSLEAMYLMPQGRDLWTKTKEGEDYSRDTEYLDLKDQLIEMMIDRTEAVIPGIKSKILWKEASTPLTQGRYIRSSDYAIYGLEANYKQFGPFRPRARTKIPGLFVAGTSTTWGPSIEGSMISGMQAAAAVLDRDLDAEIKSGHIYGDRFKITSGGEGWDPLKVTSNLNKKVKAVDIEEGC